MSQNWTPLNRLHPAKHRDAVKLRLLRHYDLKKRNSTETTVYGHQAIFQDDQGNRIHAFCEKSLIPHFTPLLKEGQLHGIENPIVSKNTQLLTDNRFQLTFVKETLISDLKDESFPQTVFKFHNFKELNNAYDISSRIMFDLIGLLHVDQPPTTRIGKSGVDIRVMDIFLEDLDGERLPCMLWSSYVEQMLEFLKQKPLHPVVAILHLCKGTVYHGTNKATTFFDVTKLILDQKFPPILDFKNKLLKRGVTPHEVLSLSASTSKSMPSQFDVKTLEEVCEAFEKGRVWILCRIVAFAHYGSWCYTSCKQCYRKVIPTNGICFCAECNLDGSVIRYRLQIRVVDETSNLTLTLWDKHCIPLFGKHAGVYLHDSGDDTEIPKEFNSIMYKPLLIELEVKTTGSSFNQKQYSVNQIIKDKEVLDRFQIDSSTTQGSVTSKPLKSIAKPIDLVGSETIPYDANVDNQGSMASTSTPNTILKRDLNIEFEDQAAQLKKKARVSVKIEKD